MDLHPTPLAGRAAAGQRGGVQVCIFTFLHAFSYFLQKGQLVTFPYHATYKKCQTCQTSDGALRSGQVVPHPAPPNVKNTFSNMFPHQLRPISTYPNPPISHIGKTQNPYFLLFPIFFPIIPSRGG